MPIPAQSAQTWNRRPRKVGGAAGSRRALAIAALVVLVATWSGTSAGAAADDGAAFPGRWSTAEGDVIEFQSQGTIGIGVLVASSPEGLGRFFAVGEPILRDVTWAGGKLSCTLRDGQWKVADDPVAHTSDYIAIGGPAEATTVGDAGEMVLRWQPIRQRHFRTEDGWHDRVERVDVQPPPLTVTLRRDARLTLLLVRGDQLEPAVALYHGLPYVAEFITRDQRLPLTVELVLAVGEDRLPLEVAAIADGAERRYRSKPFLFRPKADGGSPP